MKNITLRLLAIMAALLPAAPKALGAEAKENTKASANVSVFANIEQASHESTFGDMGVTPSIKVEKGDMNVNYQGSFYNWRNADKEHGDWSTSMNRLELDTDGWSLQLGRMQLKPKFASYLHVPMATSLGNDFVGAGANRKFTGVHYTDKESGLGVGFVAQDGHLGISHLDTAIATWEKQITPELNVAAHVAADSQRITHAGATLAYNPTERSAIVIEGLYNNDTSHAIVAASHKLREDLAAFAGFKFSEPDHGRMNGWAAAGLQYKVGKGFSAVAGIKQNFGENHNPQAIIGLQYAGNYGLGGK